MFNLFTVNHFSDQLHCPFHPPSLPHPTTLHALVGILQETPELGSPGDFTAGIVLVMVEEECVAEQNLFQIPGIIHLTVTRLRQSGSSFGLRKQLS